MLKQPINTAGKTETFFTRNVKLITFLICIAVVFSPFVYVYVMDAIEAKRLEKRPEMTVDELVLLADRAKDLRMRDFDKYEGYLTETEVQGMEYAMYRIPILHEKDLVLSISFDASMDYVFYINLINMDTRAELDLLKEAHKLEEFLTTH